MRNQFIVIGILLVLSGCVSAEKEMPIVDQSTSSSSFSLNPTSLKITTKHAWPADFVCTFYWQDRRDVNPFWGYPEPCTHTILAYSEPPANLYDIPWKYIRIAGTPFELPLPLSAEQKQGRYPTKDVYSLNDSEHVQHPDDFFGLFFDEACTSYPLCHKWLISAEYGHQQKILREFIDPQRNILVREFEISSALEVPRQEDQKYHIFSITYQGVHYAIQYFPDFDHANVEKAWNAIRYIKTDAMTASGDEASFVIPHEITIPRNQQTQDGLK